MDLQHLESGDMILIGSMNLNGESEKGIFVNTDSEWNHLDFPFDVFMPHAGAISATELYAGMCWPYTYRSGHYDGSGLRYLNGTEWQRVGDLDCVTRVYVLDDGNVFVTGRAGLRGGLHTVHVRQGEVVGLVGYLNDVVTMDQPMQLFRKSRVAVGTWRDGTVRSGYHFLERETSLASEQTMKIDCWLSDTISSAMCFGLKSGLAVVVLGLRSRHKACLEGFTACYHRLSSHQTVQFLHGGDIVAEHERGTPERIVIDPQHYEGPSTDRVNAPQPLGRMGRRIMKLAAGAGHVSFD